MQSAMCNKSVSIVGKMVKCTLKEFEEVSEVSNTSPNTRIHVVLTALSPRLASYLSSSVSSLHHCCRCSSLASSLADLWVDCFSRWPCIFFALLAAAPLAHTHRSQHGLHEVVVAFCLSVFTSIFRASLLAFSSSPSSQFHYDVTTMRALVPLQRWEQ